MIYLLRTEIARRKHVGQRFAFPCRTFHVTGWILLWYGSKIYAAKIKRCFWIICSLRQNRSLESIFGIVKILLRINIFFFKVIKTFSRGGGVIETLLWLCSFVTKSIIRINILVIKP